MKRFTQILILLVIVVLIIPIFLSKKVEVALEHEFDTPIEFTFSEFNNLKKFSDWEPWGNQDSTIIQNYFSPYQGKGAGYKWEIEENNFGEITIDKSIKNKLIEAELEGFGLGHSSQMIVEFSPVSENKSKVKWIIQGEDLSYFSRYFAYVHSDKIKTKLEEGFANLTKKLETEKNKKSDSKPISSINTENFQGQKLIAILNETTLDPIEIKTAKEESLGMLFSYLTDFIKLNQNELGTPICYYEFVDTNAQKAKFYCGYPIEGSVKLDEGMQLISLPAGQTIVSEHKGSYDRLNESLNQIKKYAKDNNLKIGNTYWEVYVKDADVAKSENDLLTQIYVPFK